MATPTLVQSVDASEVAGRWLAATVSTDAFKLRFPQPTLTGNCIIVGISLGTATVPGCSCADDAGNTYQSVSVADSGNGQNLVLFYAVNCSPAQTITITDTAGASATAPFAAEFYNVSTVSASVKDHSYGKTGSGTSVNAGASGTLTSGDLVIQYSFTDGALPDGTSNTWSPGSQSNISWNLLFANEAMWAAAQYGVYNATASFSPTMAQTKTTGWVTLVLALKSASAGTAPSGMYISAAKHLWLDSSYYSSFSTSPRTVQFPCSAGGNLLYCAWMGSDGAGDALTAVSDSEGNSWAATGAAVADVSVSHNFYAGGATAGAAMTVTLTGSFAASSAILYAIVGADSSSPFVATSTATGNQASTANLDTFTSYTPQTAKGLLFSQVGVGGNTTSAMVNAGQVIHTFLWNNEPAGVGDPDQNNGWMSYAHSSAAAITVGWEAYFPAGSNWAQWAARLDEFKAASASSFTQTLNAASASFSAGVAKDIERLLAGATSSFSGAAAKSTQMPIAAATSSFAALLQSARVIVQLLTAATAAFAAQVTKATSRGLNAATAAFAAAARKTTARSLAAASAAWSAALTAIVVFTAIVNAATANFSGAIVKRAGKAIAASPASFAGAIAKRTSRAVAAATAAFAATAQKNIARSLAAATSAWAATLAAISVFTASFNAAMATFSGSIARLTKRAFAAAPAAFAAAVAKFTTRTLAAASSAWAATLGAISVFTAAFNAAMAPFAGSIPRRTGKALAASTASFAAAVAKFTAVAIAAAASAWSAVCNAAALGTGPLRPLYAATISVVQRIFASSVQAKPNVTAQSIDTED